jgi:hypothetical protein
MTNWVGDLFGDRELPWATFDEETLVEQARRRTRWDDFGIDRFREPMRVLLQAAIEDGQLTYLGRCQLSRGIRNALCNRLRLHREFHAHPEIRAQPVRRPLIIVGAPRTGTTLLNHLLSLDPRSRPLLAWESVLPAPVRPNRKRGALPRAQLLQMALGERLLRATSPELYQMHPFSWNQPDECHWLFWPSFVFPAAMVLPLYHDWMRDLPAEPYDDAYQYYRMALQMLEWQRPVPAGGHWVLKSPLHLWALDAIARAVPEASFIQTHRSLDAVLPSFCSLVATLVNNMSDALVPEKMGPYAMQLARETIDRFTVARQSIDPARLLDLPFDLLAADPRTAVRKVYAHFDFEFSPAYDQRLQAYLADETNRTPAPHAYSPEQFGLDRDAILEAFRDYHEAFGLT